MSEEPGEDPPPKRSRGRRRLIAGGAFLLGFLLLSYLFIRPLPLPDPVAIFPEDGSLWVLDIPSGYLPELDAGFSALVAQIPPYLSYQGRPLSLPPAALGALRESGPWRMALWRNEDRSRWGILLGGEAYGFARRRWLDRILARPLPGLEEGTYGEIGGAMLIASDRSTWELLRREAVVEGLSIVRERVSLTYGSQRPLEGELWVTFPADEEWVTARTSDHRWRSWLREFGVDVELVPTHEEPSEQLWRARGIRAGLRELRAQLDRF